MKRTTKEKEERRQELIDTARQLFVEKGYEKTAVSDIVKKVKVAQGTFYYHFQSKQDILKAIAKDINADVEKDMQDIVNQKGLDPVEKINDIFSRCFTLAREHKELIQIIHMETNVLLHDQVRKDLIEMQIPIVKKVISEGRTKGKFNVAYDTETAEILVAIASNMIHRLDTTATSKRMERIIIGMEQAIARVLGVKELSFRLVL